MARGGHACVFGLDSLFKHLVPEEDKPILTPHPQPHLWLVEHSPAHPQQHQVGMRMAFRVPADGLGGNGCNEDSQSPLPWGVQMVMVQRRLSREPGLLIPAGY